MSKIAVMCSCTTCKVNLVNIISGVEHDSIDTFMEQWDDSDPADTCPECKTLGVPMGWEDYLEHAKDLLDLLERGHHDALASAPHDFTEEMMLFDDHFDKVRGLFQPANS